MLYFIGACDEERGMGFKGRLPWPRMAADIERFHKLTKNKTVVMGERTYREYQSVKHAFGVGKIYVVTRQITKLPDAEAINELEEIIRLAQNEDIWVIGGASIFSQLIDKADAIYLTRIHGVFKADVYFPKFDEVTWQIEGPEDHVADQDNPYPYSFITYHRKVR